MEGVVCTNLTQCGFISSVFINLTHKELTDSKNKGFLENNDFLIEFLKGLGHMFYVVKPSETSFEKAGDVPNYFRNAWPYFLLFMILENILLWIEKKPTLRLNDNVTSLSHGLIQECGRLLFRGSESYLYYYIYQNYRILDLRWQSPITWYLAAIGVDFCFYWVHRACHEIHILWAQHQVHHSSEDYNLAVGLRQSFFQGWCGFIFYLPLAFVIPPSHFATHQQFNLLFQFWIHTETVKNLGPLEWIFNTPSHHRVHHGSNIYCLDTNYGGVLIIWDRIFGTFARERQDEEIVYGLVYNQPSFNPLHLQSFYSQYVFQKFCAMKGWGHKMAAIFYGPSWTPGKPRLGLDADKPKVQPREKYDVRLPFWYNIYLLVHFCVIVFGFHQLATVYMVLNPVTVLLFIIYIIASLTSIGMLFDDHQYACVFEVFRCMILVVAVQNLAFPGIDVNILTGCEALFLLSGIFWFLRCVRIVDLSMVKIKTN